MELSKSELHGVEEIEEFVRYISRIPLIVLTDPYFLDYLTGWTQLSERNKIDFASTLPPNVDKWIEAIPCEAFSNDNAILNNQDVLNKLVNWFRISPGIQSQLTAIHDESVNIHVAGGGRPKHNTRKRATPRKPGILIGADTQKHDQNPTINGVFMSPSVPNVPQPNITTPLPSTIQHITSSTRLSGPWFGEITSKIRSVASTVTSGVAQIPSSIIGTAYGMVSTATTATTTKVAAATTSAIKSVGTFLGNLTKEQFILYFGITIVWICIDDAYSLNVIDNCEIHSSQNFYEIIETKNQKQMNTEYLDLFIKIKLQNAVEKRYNMLHPDSIKPHQPLQQKSVNEILMEYDKADHHTFCLFLVVPNMTLALLFQSDVYQTTNMIIYMQLFKYLNHTTRKFLLRIYANDYDMYCTYNSLVIDRKSDTTTYDRSVEMIVRFNIKFSNDDVCLMLVGTHKKLQFHHYTLPNQKQINEYISTTMQMKDVTKDLMMETRTTYIYEIYFDYAPDKKIIIVEVNIRTNKQNNHKDYPYLVPRTILRSANIYYTPYRSRESDQIFFHYPNREKDDETDLKHYAYQLLFAELESFHRIQMQKYIIRSKSLFADVQNRFEIAYCAENPTKKFVSDISHDVDDAHVRPMTDQIRNNFTMLHFVHILLKKCRNDNTKSSIKISFPCHRKEFLKFMRHQTDIFNFMDRMRSYISSKRSGEIQGYIIPGTEKAFFYCLGFHFFCKGMITFATGGHYEDAEHYVSPETSKTSSISIDVIHHDFAKFHEKIEPSNYSLLSEWYATKYAQLYSDICSLDTQHNAYYVSKNLSYFESLLYN